MYDFILFNSTILTFFFFIYLLRCCCWLLQKIYEIYYISLDIELGGKYNQTIRYKIYNKKLENCVCGGEAKIE